MNTPIHKLLMAFLLLLLGSSCEHYKNHQLTTRTSFDTSHVMQLFERAKIALNDSVDKAPSIIDEIFYESHIINWKKGIALCLYCRGKYSALKKNYPLAVTTYKNCLDTFLLTSQICKEQAEAKYNLASIYHWMGNDHSGFFYRQQAVKEYCLLNDSLDVAKTLEAMGNDYVNTGALTEEKLLKALSYWTKAFLMKEQIKDTSNRSLSQNIGLGYYMLQNNDSAEKYLRIANGKSIVYKDTVWRAVTLVQLSKIDIAKAQYSEAISKLTEAKNWYSSMGKNGLGGVATTLNNTASIFNTIGDYEQAINLYQQSLDISEKLNDAELLVANLNDLTIVYVAIKNYDDALKTLTNAKSYLLKSEEPKFLAVLDGNIGAVYYQKKNYDSAISYSQKCLQQMHLPSDSIDALITIAESYTGVGNYKKAYNNYSIAYNITTKTGDKLNQAKILTGMAQLQMSLLKEKETDNKIRYNSIVSRSKLKLAEQYIDTAITYSKSTASISDLEEEYKILYDIQKQSGNYQGALNSIERHYLYRDSIRSSDKVKEVVRKDLQYKYEKKAAALKAKAEKREVIMISTGVAMFVIALLSFFFYRKLEKDKFQLELNATKQEALNAQMSDHFIFNSMDSINNFIEKNDKKNASDYLILFRNVTREVLHNSTKNMIPLANDLKVLKDYLELEKLRFPVDKFHYDIVISKDIDTENTLIPPMVFQTLAENSIKHAFKKSVGGTLKFSIRKEKNQIVCDIEDNGIGRKAAMESKDISKQEHVSLGSTIAEKLVKTASKYGKATSFKIIDLFDNNNSPKGTLVKFSIPFIPNIA